MLKTKVLVLARRTTPTVLADATCLVVLQRGVGGNRLADPVVAARPPVAGSVHESNVTERPGPVRTTSAEPTSSQLDAGSTVATLSEPLTGDEIRQPAFTLGAVVLRRTEAAASSSVSNSSAAVPTISGETDVVLTEPALVHGVRAKALRLAVLKVARAVVLAGEAFAGALFYTSWTGDARRANTPRLLGCRV